MKAQKVAFIAYVVYSAILIIMSVGIIARASDVTGASYITRFQVINNGASTATNEIVVVELPSPAMIEAGILSANATGAALRTSGGTDIGFGPSINATTPWVFYVDSIAASEQLDRFLYTKDATGGKYRIYPDSGGLVVADNSTAELGDNATLSISGLFNTANGSAKNLFSKIDAFKVYWSPTVAGNLTASIYPVFDSADWETPDAIIAGGWTNASYAIDDNTGTFAYYNINASSWSPYITANHTSEVGSDLIDRVRYWVDRNNASINNMELDVYYSGNWTNLFTGNPTTGSWQTATIGSIEFVTAARIRLYNSHGGAQYQAQLQEFDFGHIMPKSVSAIGLTSVEYTADINIAPLVLAPADVLDFTAGANSEVNFGAIYNSANKLWISFWFKLDSPHTGASATQILIGKRVHANDYFMIQLLTGNGYLNVIMKTGAVQRFSISVPKTSWTADTWFHVLASVNQSIGGGAASDGTRLRYNNTTVATSSDNHSLPNGANFLIGERIIGEGNGITGNIVNVIVGTDDLTLTEEAGLYAGIAPADATDIWYIDEGTGTTITSYGTAANAGTAGAATSWDNDTRPCKFTIDIDGTPVAGFARYVTVVDNTNPIKIAENEALLFVETASITVDGEVVASYEWQYTNKLLDLSGNGNTANVTYRTTGTNADLVVTVASQDTTLEGDTPSSTAQTGFEMVGSVPDTPSELYTEGGTTYPGGQELVDLADDTKVPYMVWAVLLALGTSLGLGAVAYGMTHNRAMGRNGSLFVLWIVSTVVMTLWVIGGGGVIPGWILIPYGFAFLCLAVWFNPYKKATG